MNSESDDKDREDDGFVKDAVVRPAHTPSVVSGRPSELVKRGEAYVKGEPEVSRLEDLGKEF
jgi:hypothetical protein